MADVFHSEVDVESRHPIHGVQEFANQAAREAHTYAATDEGKVVRQLDDDSYHLIQSVTAGNATFISIENHSTIAVANRHPIHGVQEFDDQADREAHTYTAADEGKVVRQLDDDSYHLIQSVTAGVATFIELGSVPEGVFLWHPDLPPASPSSDDIYFSGSSWSGWTEWDPSTSVAWDVDTNKNMGRAVQTGDGAVRFSGMYRAIPNSEFAFYTQPNMLSSPGGTGCVMGLFVAGDISGSPTTADFRSNEITFASSSPMVRVRARTWDAYNGSPSAVADVTNVFPTHLRMRVNGTTVMSDYSVGGTSWLHFDTTVVGFTPAYFGAIVLAADSGIQSTMLFRYIKTFSGSASSGYVATELGRAGSILLGS